MGGWVGWPGRQVRGLIVQPDTLLLALGMLGTPADLCVVVVRVVWGTVRV